MAEIVSILNLKGGVGKTTTTINLGKALSLCGKKVLVIDNDPQANLTHGVGIENPETTIYHTYKFKEGLAVYEVDKNFSVVPSQLSLASIENEVDSSIYRYNILKDVLAPVSEKYDFILIDCPPSLGVYTINAVTASTKYIITTQTASYSIDGLFEAIKLIEGEIKKGLNKDIELLGVLITQYFTNRIASDVALEKLENKFEGKIFKTKIRHTTKFREAELSGEDIFSYDKQCYGAVDYMGLAKEISE
ncbi:MAG: chromosome partitioning protein [Thalassobius sp.]|nr:chromosome partitioning protein [Thalassovita sp.]